MQKLNVIVKIGCYFSVVWSVTLKLRKEYLYAVTVDTPTILLLRKKWTV